MGGRLWGGCREACKRRGGARGGGGDTYYVPRGAYRSTRITRSIRPGSVQASWGLVGARGIGETYNSRSLQEHKNHKEHKEKERKRVSSSALALDWLSSGANNATLGGGAAARRASRAGRRV